MAKIAQLSPHLADLIAAGEVVERPGSVVKELLENAIDAGASHITVEIQHGGITLIRVTDDGCGMDRQDAQLAFLRHATSKLRREEDLAAIGTLGFRGEALAAISAVSRVRLLTRPAADTEGTAVTLEGGTITACDPAGCPAGTTLVVKDLFFNTPARLKFMKSDMAEGAFVSSVVHRLSMAHPEIAFRFFRDGQEQLSTPGDGRLLSAVYAVFGRQSAKEMIHVDGRSEKFAVQGFVSLPAASRGNRSGQFFYVNGRNIQSKLLTAALEEAYRNQMLPGRFPSCVLNLQMPLSAVDVNVHPAKTQVRFLSEKAVFDCVHYGVLSALNKASGKRDMIFPEKKEPHPTAAVEPASRTTGQNAGAGSSPAAGPEPSVLSRLQKAAGLPPLSDKTFLFPDAAEAPLRSAVIQPIAPAASTPLPVYQVKEVAGREDGAPEEPGPEQTALPLQEAPSYRVIGEVMDSFFLVEEPGALLFIDKHAAHERMLFEKLKKSYRRPMSQMLLTPIPASLSREDAAILLEHAALLRDCGYELEDFGDHTVLIRAVPDDIGAEDAESTLAALASDLQSGRRADPDSLRDSLLHTIACKAAIKAGWHTEPAERDALIREVMTRDDLKYCPHGRPICIRMTEASLRRQFKRS